MKINQCLVLTFAAIGFTGCVTVKPAYGPDGTLLISCQSEQHATQETAELPSVADR